MAVVARKPRSFVSNGLSGTIQKNILKLTCGNIYNSSFYDLSEKKLYNFDNIDLKTLKYKK